MLLIGKLLAAVAVSLSVVSAPTAVAADDDRPCGTHNEWDQVDVFMTRAHVADIIGSSGVFLSDNGDVTRRGYNLCWTTDQGVVRYDDQSGLSIGKNVVD